MSLALDNSTISLPAGAHTVTTLTDYLANNAVFNVKDYGAAVDGSTVDTLNFTAAITAAGAACGGVVLIPAGTMAPIPRRRSRQTSLLWALAVP